MKKEITISYLYRNNNRPVSKITISNHTLNKCGFSIGDKAVVEYSKNQIIIKKLK